ALIAGFPIVERFHHRTAPSYVPAGRDAAVAYPGIDLRFRNDLPEPIRLHTFIDGNRLRVEIWTKSAIQRRAEIVTHVLAHR
ncbi:VanW family protein, partial [Klebsiella pneumoniae]|uniref:VanW family protein n=1 Tax=Klebsiella pneumoniae TaxID=573 RepID=UPI003EE31D95